MDRLRLANRRLRPAAVVIAMVLGMLVLASGRAEAQCYQTSGYIYDNCGSSSQTQYEWYPALTDYFLGTPGHNQLVLGLNNDLQVFELGSNPLSPQLLSSLHIPWDWTTIDVGGSTHEQYIQHVRHIATLPGYQYTLVSLATYGWDFLQLGASPHFLGNGFHPTAKLPYSYVSSVLYQPGNNVYAIGQMLDQASYLASDTSMRIYLIDNGSTVTPQNVTFTNMGQGVRIPVGGPTDPPGFTDADVTLAPVGAWRFQLEEVGGRQLLFARRNAPPFALLVIDVTDPTNPVPEQLYTDADLPNMFTSNWVAGTSSDGTTSLWVADNATMSVHRFVVTIGGPPFNLPSVADAGATCWVDQSPCPAATKGFVGVAGDLVTVGVEKSIGYLTLTGGTPQLLPPQNGFTTLVRPACAVPQYSENVIIQDGLAPFQVGGEYYVGRGMFVDADVISVADACMATTPIPNFSVTGGEAGATCNPSAADDGFPGDTFAITDTSVGQYDSAVLDLKDPNNVEVVGFPVTIAPKAATPFTAPQNLAGGAYTATLSIVGGTPPSVTKTIQVCNNPKAALALTPGSQVLVNEQVTASAAGTAGFPSAYRFWVTTPSQNSSELPGSGSSRTYIPTIAGQYTLGVVAQYLFPATNDAACGAIPLPTLLAPGVYNACTSQALTAGYGVSSFEVWQNGIKIADSSNGSANPGLLLVDQQTTLKFTGELATGYTPYFAWNIPGATPGNCTYTAPPYTGSTCTIPAGTWSPGAAFAMNMTLHACLNGTPGIDCGATNSIPAAAVWVQPSLNTFTFTATPSSVDIGAPVTITLGTVTGTFSSMTFAFGGAACDGSTQKTVSCLSPFGGNICTNGAQLFSYSYAAGGATYTVSGTGMVGGVQVNATGSPQVTVSAQGTCVCPSVTASISGPSSATIGIPVTFSASASTGGGATITGYSWTFGDGGSASGQTVTHTFTSSGTRTVQLTVTNSCGSVGTASKVIFVSGGGGTLTISPYPQTTYVGTQVTFTFSPGVSRPGDWVTLNFGDGSSQTLGYISFCQNTPCNTLTHTYTQSGGFTVNGSGIAGGSSVSGSTSVTINGNCSAVAAPVANFSFAPTDPAPGDAIQFTDASTNGPTAWSWKFGDGGPVTGGGSSTLQNPTYSYAANGTYTITLTASNCKGSGTTTQTVTVAQCIATEVPTASFDYEPKETITVGGVAQDQPYVGETVTLTDTSTNQPISRHWDFGDGATADTAAATVTHAWVNPGPYAVTLTATNCIGPSQPYQSTINVVDDVRPVTADFSWNPVQPSVGQPVSFTAAQGAGYGDPTSFTWVFSDDPSAPAAGVSVNHSFTCGGAVQATLTAGRNGITGTTPKIIQVSGTPACGPQSVISADAAKVQGLNGTYWRTDMRIFNPSDQTGSITLGALPVSRDNGQPFELPAFSLAPKSTLVLDDVIQEFIQAGASVQKAAILTQFPSGDPVPVVSSRTYTNAVSGGNYGQSVAGIQVWPGTTPSPLWITGVRNDGSTTGFRTNFGMTNLRGDSSAAGVQVSVVGPTGSVLASKAIDLPPYGYLQDSVKNLFGASLEDIGPFAIKVELPPAVDVEPYGSLVDNQTGDPTLIEGEPVAQGAVYLVAVAHLPGENGTVWRTDAEFTNPDGMARTWNVTFTPKQFAGSLTRPITLGPGNSLAVQDLVNWVYQQTGGIPPDSVSGVVTVIAADGLPDMPIVAARTYNLTEAGTFGHGIPALDASRGATAGGLFSKLMLTGMSSQDVARSNLGFVNLGTGSVNFNVLLYDESGNLLNPDGSPIQISLGPNGWDQDKLENRFKNTFGADLPANLRAVSAVITVVNGGPGYAYASVVDNVTGDPIFIGGQLAP